MRNADDLRSDALPHGSVIDDEHFVPNWLRPKEPDYLPDAPAALYDVYNDQGMYDGEH